MIQQYVDQLVEDFRQATERRTRSDTSANTTILAEQQFQQDINRVNQYLYGPHYKLSEIVGIDKVALPADDLLNDEQTGELALEMEKLLNAWNFYPEFPNDNAKTVPARLRYRVMRSGWDTEQAVVDTGEVHIEF